MTSTIEAAARLLVDGHTPADAAVQAIRAAINEIDNDAVANPDIAAYRHAATEAHAWSDDVDIDADAVVSVSDEGAYVQAWLFVPRREMLSFSRITRKG